MERKTWLMLFLLALSSVAVYYMPLLGTAAEAAPRPNQQSPTKSIRPEKPIGQHADNSQPEDHPTPTEIRKWSDEQLRAALENAELGREDERVLLEIVHRGGEQWKKLLATRYDKLVRLIESPLPDTSSNESFKRWSLSNLDLLTALRRVQNRPDPLRILVAGKLERTYSLEESPRFTLLITNLDEEKQTVHGFTDGGDYRSGRLGRWRFEVHDEKGKMLPIKSPFGFMGGGIFQRQTLEYGESWETELPLESYVDIAAPGKYTMRVFYHNEIAIVDCGDISDLITSHSAEIKLEVRPIRVWVTEKQRQEARKWIAELPDAGPVKMELGGLVEDEKFLDPKSAPGRLQWMGTSAVPDLVDAAVKPSLKPAQRAWVLGLLFAITGHNNPLGSEPFSLDGEEILGSYEYEYSSGGSGSCRRGKIDPEKQRAFAEKWRVWKTDHYYTVEKP